MRNNHTIGNLNQYIVYFHRITLYWKKYENIIILIIVHNKLNLI